MNKDNTLMLNVYLPYCCPENFYSYQAYLGELSTTCDSQDAYAVYIVGDFNAGRSNHFWQSLTEFCSDNNFVISDERLLPVDFLPISAIATTLPLGLTIVFHLPQLIN